VPLSAVVAVWYGASPRGDRALVLRIEPFGLDQRLRSTSAKSVWQPVPSENLIRWIRIRKENRIMIETDGDLLQTSARIYVGLLSFT